MNNLNLIKIKLTHTYEKKVINIFGFYDKVLLYNFNLYYYKIISFLSFLEYTHQLQQHQFLLNHQAMDIFVGIPCMLINTCNQISIIIYNNHIFFS